MAVNPEVWTACREG